MQLVNIIMHFMVFCGVGDPANYLDGLPQLLDQPTGIRLETEPVDASPPCKTRHTYTARILQGGKCVYLAVRNLQGGVCVYMSPLRI
jgi:hypothetical protein